MTDSYPNNKKLLQNIKAGTPKYNFNARLEKEVIETAEKAYFISLAPSHKQFLEWFNGGMILEENIHFYIDMLEDEPDGPIDSSFYIFPLDDLIDKYRDLRLDKWLMRMYFDGIYPIIPICSTPHNDLLFMISGRGLSHESPVFSTSFKSEKGSPLQIANDFNQFLGFYIKHKGFPQFSPGLKAPSVSDFMEKNNVLSIANEVLTYEQSLEQANAMIKRNPGDEWGYCERGNLYEANGFRKLALADFNKAIKLDATEAFFYYCRGDLVLKYGSARKALIDIDTAVHLEPTDKLYLSRRGEAYLTLAQAAKGELRESKLQKALNDLNEVLNMDGVYTIALMARCRVYTEMGEKEKAATDSALIDDLLL